LSIVREYKAKGQFTSVLLGVIALDDALTLIFFAFAIAVGQSLIGGEGANMSRALLEPLRTIALEMALGAIIGLLLSRIIPFFTSRKALFGLTIGAIFLSGGIAISLELSPLLNTMTLGFVLINLGGRENGFEAFEVIENIEESIFGIFFALAGAHLQLAMLSKAVWLIVLLTLGRFAGKFLGATAGAIITDAPVSVRKYLGIALLPAAGVTIGLMLEVNAVYGQIHPKLCEIMVSAVVGATLVNELLTPFLVRYSLVKSGDVQMKR
jgi:Kef-type K+ transport system membrane component KefB